MNVEMKLVGFRRVMNKLRRLAARNPAPSDEVLEKFAEEQRQALKGTRYPARRAGQRYHRTGLLANSWRKRKQGPGRWAIINSARYSGWVVGEEQAWMHAGRWWRARDVLEKALPDLVRRLNAKYLKIWNS